MAKVKAVKWSIGAEEPEDLDDFLSNDDIVLKNTKGKGKNAEVQWPGKGPFTFKVVQARIKPNKNGDDRIGVMLALKEPKKSDASSWNGYVCWDGFNVTEQGTPFIKRWLKAMGVSWKEFHGKTKMDDQDPPHIVQIGRVKFEDVKDVLVRATVVVKPADDYNDDEHLEIRSYLPAGDDEPDDEPDEDEEVEEDDEAEDFDEEDEADEDEDEDEEDDDEEEDEDDEEDDDDEDERAELVEELSSLTLANLKKRGIRSAKKAGVDTDDMPTKKAKLVEWVASVELDEPPF